MSQQRYIMPDSKLTNTVCLFTCLIMILSILAILKTKETLTLEDSDIYQLEVFRNLKLFKSLSNDCQKEDEEEEQQECISDEEIAINYPNAVKFDKNILIHHKNFDCKFGNVEKYPDYGKYSDELKTYSTSSLSRSQKFSECKSYLSTGKWELSDFTKSYLKNKDISQVDQESFENNEDLKTFQDIQFNPNATYKKNLNGNGLMRWTSPSANCRPKIYNDHDIHQCLSNYFPRIQIVGDSRSAVLWNFFKLVLKFKDPPFFGYFTGSIHALLFAGLTRLKNKL